MNRRTIINTADYMNKHQGILPRLHDTTQAHTGCPFMETSGIPWRASPARTSTEGRSLPTWVTVLCSDDRGQGKR